MSMIKCQECGKEISDKAKKCPDCGYPQKILLKSIFTNKKTAIISAITVIVIIISVFLFQCFSRPNIKMRDLDVENGKISTLLFLGYPDNIVDGEWKYYNNIEFYNIPTDIVTFNFNKNEYRIYFDDDVDCETIEEILLEHCRCLYDECSSFSSVYTYAGLRIEYIDEVNVIYINE